MSIATLPPQNHVNALRSFLNRLRRTKTATAQEISHAEDALQALEDGLKKNVPTP